MRKKIKIMQLGGDVTSGGGVGGEMRWMRWM